jgi:hypothetical protein
MLSREKNIEQHGKRNSKSSSVGDTAIPELEYVNYILKMTFTPRMVTDLLIANEDRTKYPMVVTDAYVPGSTVLTATATIKNSTYTYPKDFDFDYTFHSELNEGTGYGFELIKEKLYFKNLPGEPTLMGLAEEKSSGVSDEISEISHIEMFGNFQLRGTGIFNNVKGSGIAIFGASTGFVVHHIAWIKGWPLV